MNRDTEFQEVLHKIQKSRVRIELLNEEKASEEGGKNASTLACKDPPKFQMA